MSSEPTIRNCVFAFKCTKKWDELDATDVSTVRHCQDCEREVHFCATDTTLAKAVKRNLCVAIIRQDAGEALGELVMGVSLKDELRY